MKKITITTMAIAFCSIFASAQSIKLIPKIGVNLASYSLSDDIKQGFDSKSITGLNFGAGVELGITDGFAIQPEVLFNKTGYKLEGNGDGVSIKGNFSFNTVQIPVLLKYSIGKSDGPRVFVLAGPYLSYNLGGTLKAEYNNGQTTTSYNSKIKWGTEPDGYTGTDVYYGTDSYRRADYGVNVGLGGSIPLGPGAISLEARYGLGFSDFNKNNSNQSSDTKSKSRVLGLQLGYVLSFGR